MLRITRQTCKRNGRSSFKSAVGTGFTNSLDRETYLNIGAQSSDNVQQSGILIGGSRKQAKVFQPTPLVITGDFSFSGLNVPQIGNYSDAVMYEDARPGVSANLSHILNAAIDGRKQVAEQMRGQESGEESASSSESGSETETPRPNQFINLLKLISKISGVFMTGGLIWSVHQVNKRVGLENISLSPDFEEWDRVWDDGVAVQSLFEKYVAGDFLDQDNLVTFVTGDQFLEASKYAIV